MTTKSVRRARKEKKRTLAAKRRKMMTRETREKRS